MNGLEVQDFAAAKEITGGYVLAGLFQVIVILLP
jgi:hypothetical protein